VSPRPTQRWAALLLAVAVSGALFLSGGSAWLQARSASERIVDSSAAELRATLNGELRGVEPTAELLTELLDALAPQGLRAVIWAQGGAVVQAGEEAELVALRPMLTGPPAPWRRVGDRVRATSRARVRGRGRLPRRRAGARGGAVLAFSFEPIQAIALESGAALRFALGTGSSLLLILFAVVLGRQWVAADRLAKERQAEHHLAMLGTMSAVLGHEIKNPLASLKGNAQMLERKLTDPDLLRKASRVVREAERLEALTSRILAFARDEPLRRELTDVPGLLGAVVGRVDDAVASEIPSMEPFPLDAQWVEQAVENLLRNARDASPGGAVVVRARQDGQELCIEVADDGPGIPRDLRDRVLEPFHTDKVQGTGLGLAVVSRVAERHDGRVEIDDAPGGGAVVRMILRRS